MSHRLLVVDDEPAVREILAAMLEVSGYDVFVAGLASEALRLLDQRRFDLVLLDVNMPGVSGWKILDSVRRSDPPTPVLMISDERYREEAIRRGAVGFLGKPYRRKALEDAVREALAPETSGRLEEHP